MYVLVIDDDCVILEMISKILTRENYNVLTSSNGNEGMEIINSTPGIDLVITDLIMPDKEGMETIQDLKRNFPDIKILAISGGGRAGAESYLPVAKLIGADLTLNKPFVAQELVASVQKLSELN